ncbi:MAG: hypothetical protein DA405_10415 [Bacteroidetes bacterium]|nr:MAG: hypothetical protein DA405_10415 [Bacteroidota bacterium]
MNKSPRKRLEVRGKNIRISRTGGVSATKTIAGDGYGATINTKHGLRLHKRIAKGTRVGFQNGNLQLIGRFSKGPFNFNVSKGGLSTSIRNERGSYNILKPNYSSFKIGGIQLRGKKAANLQMIYFFIMLTINIFKLTWHFVLTLFWLVTLALRWLFDFTVGFYKVMQERSPEGRDGMLK